MEFKMNKAIIITKAMIVTGAIAIALIFLSIVCFKKIGPGYVGVVYSPNGGVKEKILTQGWNFINPLYKVTEYTISTEQAFLSKDRKEGSNDDDSFLVPTSDGKMVSVDLEYSYRFDPEMVTSIFTRFRGRTGQDIQNTFMRGKLKTWASEVASKFNVLDIYGSKRIELNTKAFNHIQKQFEPYGIIIESVNFSRIGLDAETENAIQARVNAQQELEKQKIEKEKAVIEAERMAIEEQGKGNVKIIQAKAEAERILLNAEAVSQSNIKISKSLTKELVEYERVKKWNGIMPTVQGNATPIVKL